MGLDFKLINIIVNKRWWNIHLDT